MQLMRRLAEVGCAYVNQRLSGDQAADRGLPIGLRSTCFIWPVATFRSQSVPVYCYLKHDDRAPVLAKELLAALDEAHQ